MNDDTLASSLWTSFANVHAAAVEAEALIDTIAIRLSEKSDFICIYDDDAFVDEENGDWLNGAYYFSYIVKSRKFSPKLSGIGSITFGISFWREEDDAGDSWSGAKKPKLYVGFSPKNLAPWFNEDLLVTGAFESPDNTAVGPFLWVEDPTDLPLKDQAWFFCVDLMKIKNPDHITSEVTGPLFDLIYGMSQNEAFAKAEATFKSIK